MMIDILLNPEKETTDLLIDPLSALHVSRRLSSYDGLDTWPSVHQARFNEIAILNNQYNYYCGNPSKPDFTAVPT
jgi:hypothetical protein